MGGFAIRSPTNQEGVFIGAATESTGVNRYQLLGMALGVAAVGNLALAVANVVEPGGSLAFALSEATGGVLLGVFAVQVGAGHEHTDWAASPFGRHGPEIVAGVVGLAGFLMLGVGLDRLL
jgi:hypothetical protein